jgi:hypothetical protein
MRIFLLAILLFTINQHSFAQEEIKSADIKILKEFEDTIGLLSFLVINDSIDEHRFAACKKLIPTLVKALKVENSFQYAFSEVKSISIQYPQDSSFRVFTWQLYVDVDEYRYYGAIQMNEPQLKLFPLMDRSYEIQEEEYEIVSNKNWYGALYYNIKQFDTPKGRQYLLFGFDGFSFFEKRKIIDVLTIKEDEVTFGAPVFITYDLKTGQEYVKNRIVKTYSAESAFKLNYDLVYEVILFDHLIMTGGMANQGPSWVPDGSYEGYRLDKGYWYHIPKMFNEVSEEAPRDFPVLDSRKGIGIMGKGKKTDN